MEAGHPDAWDYTIGRIVDESQLVEDREAARMTEMASMMRLALSAVPNMAVDPEDTKAAQTALRRLVDENMRH